MNDKPRTVETSFKLLKKSNANLYVVDCCSSVVAFVYSCSECSRQESTVWHMMEAVEPEADCHTGHVYSLGSTTQHHHSGELVNTTEHN